jgi:hypothetical protein
MPQSGSEPKFEPELFRTEPKSGPKFERLVEPDLKSSPGFETEQTNANPFERVRTSVNLVRNWSEIHAKAVRKR